MGAVITGNSTSRLSADQPADIATAAATLKRGGLVAIPTETVYGLAANALDPAAVESIFAAKGRPHWDPLIVHIADRDQLPQIAAEVPEMAQKLMDAFWPGPLTLLLPRHPALPDAVTAGRDLVGVRMPKHPAALAVIRAAGLPLAAPSANIFGHISPTTADHVLDDLDGRIDAILDAGASSIGIESTVFSPSDKYPVILRQGGISKAQLEHVLGVPVYVQRETPRPHRRPDSYSAIRSVAAEPVPDALPSPGMGMRHYAPRARLMLVHDFGHLIQVLSELSEQKKGVLLHADWPMPQGEIGEVKIHTWASSNDQDAMAATLYSGLRALDASGVDYIVTTLPKDTSAPLAAALRDRLIKAARDVSSDPVKP